MDRFRRIAFLVFPFLLLVPLKCRVQAGVIYQQSSTYDSIGNYNTYTSIRLDSTGQYIWATFDDFTLNNTASVVSVGWQGQYRDFQNDSANPIQPNAVAFEIHFWLDNGFEFPGAYLGFQSLDIGDVNQEFNSLANFNASSGTIQVPVFDYFGNLNTPVTFQGGQKYWMSIIARTVSNSNGNPNWSWMSGFAPDGSLTPNGTLQQNVPNGTFFNRFADRSFSLHVPEPTSLLTFSCVGICGLFARKRRARACEAIS